MKPTGETINVRTIPGSPAAYRRVVCRRLKCGWTLRYPSKHNDVPSYTAAVFLGKDLEHLFTVVNLELAFDIGTALDTKL